MRRRAPHCGARAEGEIRRTVLKFLNSSKQLRGEAEDAAHLRRPRKAVRELLLQGEPHERPNGRFAFGAARDPARQRGLPPQSGDVTRASAPTGPPPAFHHERQTGERAVHAGAAGRRSRGRRDQHQVAALRGAERVCERPSRSRLARIQRTIAQSEAVLAKPARADIDTNVEEQLIVEYYSR